MLDGLLQNVKLATRGFRRERSVAIVAIGSLAIGIAANASIFSLLQAVEFPRLIYPDASRIVFLESRNDALGLVGMPVSAPDAVDITASASTLTLASLAADSTIALNANGGPRRRASGRRVAPSFFDVLRVPAAHGRVFAAADGDDVIVLSDELWRTQFGADPAIVNQIVRVDDGAARVVGVMPPRYDGDADFWMPLPASTLASAKRDDRQLTLFARLAPGRSIDDATREIAGVSQRLALASPATNKDWVSFPTLLTRMHGRDSRGAFRLLQAAVGIVLLIACANIANILLARGTRRRREMALRVSLGATRSRLLGQLLTESLMLAAVGGALGVTLSLWGIRLARAIGGFPDVIDPTMNATVLGFAVALTMTTGVLCGILPALRAARISPERVLRAGDPRAGATGRGRLRATLVAVQVASAVVLVTCGALMLRSLVNRDRVDLGFNPHGAVQADLTLAGGKYRDDAAVRGGADVVIAEIARQTDVRAVGASVWALPVGVGAQQTVIANGQPLDAGVRRSIEAVTPDYFTALGVRLKLGRTFTASDRAGAPPVAIVNDELARRLWPGRSPIGETLQLGEAGSRAPVATVIGVVGSIRRSAMHDFVIARMYLSFAQYPGASLHLVARTGGDASVLPLHIQNAVNRADASLILENLRTMDDDLSQFVAPVRLITSLLGGFSAAGLLLAALGVFGTMTYSVSQREREMAVRSALGANRRNLVRLVLRQGLAMTLVGLLPGVVAAVAAARALQSFLFGVAPTDPITLSLVVIGLAIVSTVACYRPARAAASVDPMTILRRE